MHPNDPAPLQASAVRCYPVPAELLGEALAGRLVAALNESKPDRTPQHWLYRAGHAAGGRWAAGLATAEDLAELLAADRLPHLVAPAWLRGFVDGALAAPDRPA